MHRGQVGAIKGGQGGRCLPLPANQRQPIVFTPKLKYNNSSFNDAGVFVLTKRKRALPTEAEKEAKRRAREADVAKRGEGKKEEKIVGEGRRGAVC